MPEKHVGQGFRTDPIAIHFSGLPLYSFWPLQPRIMSRALRITLFAAIPITLLVLLPVAADGIDRAVASGNVPRNVTVAGVEIGGASPEEAAALIEAYEQELQTSSATVVVVVLPSI